jgi:glycosyltransferase involved in cell wall biosynthesis
VAIVEASRALQRDGVSVRVVSTDLAGTANDPIGGRLSAAQLPPGAEELDILICRARPPRRVAFSPSLTWVLRREIKAADVVHVHALHLFPQLAAFLNSASLRVPYIVAPCGALAPYIRQRGRIRKGVTDRLWQRRMLDGAALIHFKSPGEAEGASDLGLTAPTWIVPNGIRCSEYESIADSGAFRERYFAGRTGPLVVTVGRIAHEKAPDVLVQAFGRVLERHPDALLALIGPDDQGRVASLVEIAESGGFADRVAFPGLLDGERKLEALAAADLFALPSRTENFGNAMLEAFAAGLPTVVSDAVGLAPELEAAGAARVVPPTVPAFADALGALLHDAALREGLSLRGREFARRYDWSAVAPRYRAMYEHAVGAPTRRAS